MVAGKSLVVPGNRKYLCELTPSSFLISAIKPSARSSLPFKRASLHFFRAPNLHPTCLCWARSHHRHIARSIGPSLVVNYLADAVRRDPIGLPNIRQGIQTWVRINRRRAVQTDRSGSHSLRASPPSGRVNFRKIQRKSIIRVGIKRCPNERGASARLSSNLQLPNNPSTAPQNFQNAFLRRYRFHRSPRPLPLPCSCCSQRRCYRVGWQLLQRQRRTRRPLRWLLPRLWWPQLVPRKCLIPSSFVSH